MIRLSLYAAALFSVAIVSGCAPLQAPPQPIPEFPVRSAFGEDVPLVTLALWHARDLSLTGEQIFALEALRTEFQREADVQAAELQRIELELQRLLSREEVDLAQVEARIRRVEAIRTDLRLGRIKAVEKAKATLTPEQRQKLEPLLRGGP